MNWTAQHRDFLLLLMAALIFISGYYVGANTAMFRHYRANRSLRRELTSAFIEVEELHDLVSTLLDDIANAAI
jgi:hypothetical protein